MNARLNAFMSVVLAFAVGSWLWSVCSLFTLQALDLNPSFVWGDLDISIENERNWTRSGAIFYFMAALLGLPILAGVLSLVTRDLRATNHPLRSVIFSIRLFSFTWPGAFLASAFNKTGVVADFLVYMGIPMEFSLVFFLIGFSVTLIPVLFIGPEILQFSNSASLLQTHGGKSKFAFWHLAFPALILAVMTYFLGRRNTDHLFFWWASLTALGSILTSVALSFGFVGSAPSVYKNSTFYKIDYRLLIFGAVAFGSFILVFFQRI